MGSFSTQVFGAGVCLAYAQYISRVPAQAADAHFRHYFALSLAIYAALGLVSLLLFVLLWTPLAPALSLPHPKP